MCIITSAITIAGLTISAAVANTVVAVGAVATVAGSVLGGISSYQQGKTEAAAQQYNAQVARQNAEIAKNNAAMERQAGIEEARKQRIATLQAIGQQEVGLAANGIDIGYGTSLDLIEDTAELGELDALLIQQDAEKRARNYEIQANNFINEARLAEFTATNAKKAGTMGLIAGGTKAVGSLASTLGGSFIGTSSGIGSGISWGTAASGAKIGTQGSKIYAGLGSGLA